MPRTTGQDKPRGVRPLVVEVVAARGLIAADASTSDPYVTLQLGPDTGA